MTDVNNAEQRKFLAAVKSLKSMNADTVNLAKEAMKKINENKEFAELLVKLKIFITM